MVSFKKNGYINVDFSTQTKPDIIHNLNVIPYPFRDNQFDLIEADHVLEHLNNPFAVIKELHRISRNSALWKIKVPHFTRGFSHPEHKSGFDITFPYYYNKNFAGGFQGIELEVIKLKLHWFSQPYLKKTVLSTSKYYAALSLGKIFSFIANLSPELCSRIWSFWVGGFEEIEFEFKVIK